MKNNQKYSLFLLRVSMGFLMLYAGWTKIIDPEWSAAGYLSNSQTFPELYSWFLQPAILPVINLINEWGLVLLGISLIFGIFVRLSSLLGALLMILYYFPALDFPYIGTHLYIIDEHIIYALVLISFWAIKAGRIIGFDKKLYPRFKWLS